MRKFILLIGLLLPSLALAQGSRFDGVVQGLNGPLPNQFVAVCTQPANITTTPCSTLATLYTDDTLAIPCAGIVINGCSNPIETDEFGNFHFYAAVSKYTLQSYGAQIQTPYVQVDIPIPCDPTNCVLGTITFGTLIHNSSNVALSGTIRLQNNDTICWRNVTNTGDLCLSLSGNTIIFPGGFGGGGGGSTVTVNGVNPGATVDFNNTTPAAGANNLNVTWQQTTGSASAEVPITGNGTKVVSGAGSYTTNNCLKTDSNHNAVDAGAPCGGSGVSLSAQTTCNLGSDIIGIGSTTLTTVVACVAVAPSSGCPCRAFVSWNIVGHGTSSTQQAEGLVTDGTSTFLGTSSGIDNQISTGYKSMDRSGWSPNLYSNSQSVTFTMKIESDHTIDVRTATFYNSLPTQVVVNYIPSN